MVDRPRKQTVLGLGSGLISATVAILPITFLESRAPRTLFRVGQDPFTILGINTFTATLLALIVSGVIAGVVARGTSLPTPFVAAGVVLVHSAAIAQTWIALHLSPPLASGHSNEHSSTVWILLIISITGSVLALISVWLITHRSRTLVALALGLAAVPLAAWLSVLLAVAFPSIVQTDVPAIIDRYFAALVAGSALVLCGLRGCAKKFTWLVILLTLWIAPGLLTLSRYLISSRIKSEILSAAQAVLSETLPHRVTVVFATVAVALTVALLSSMTRTQQSG